MAYVILDTCSQCGLCVDECPIDAIELGDPIYVITDMCCEFQECVAVCPEEAIVHENLVERNLIDVQDNQS
ncbi:MAG: 4Fe-4S binding protein [Bacteroidetes bacterium]|nr:4Fe-4S binding protein [Bacteroidota bacterium]